MRALLFFVLFLGLAGSMPAAVVRLAPDFTFPAAGSQGRSLRGLRGQPVVLIIAASPETKLFRKQLKVLRRGYSQFASRQTVFAVAFREGGGPVQSNVPFVVATQGARVAAAYGVNDDFCVAIIGKDGNLDYQTGDVVAPERMIDVIQNAAPVQADGRRALKQ